ncbi:MAG: phosphatase PAP2 family protein [Pseudomonadota bacterium]|nr:phosphatase PAP2 family protein [Pseudomonadota bacterium]
MFAALAVGAGCAVFTALALQIEPGTALTRFDLAVSGAILSQMPPAVVRGFSILTHAGDSATRTGLAVFVGAALVLWRQPLLALGFVGGLAGNGALTTLLKHLFGRQRPLQPLGGATADGYSFPSGHSGGAVVACGLLVYLVLRLLPPRWHLPSLCIAVALSLSIGFSRIVIRAHFPSDVLAGFAAGAVWLVVCVCALEAARRRWPAAVGMGRMTG